MEIELKANPEEIIKKFSALKSDADVADLLEIKITFLNAILHGVEERKKIQGI